MCIHVRQDSWVSGDRNVFENMKWLAWYWRRRWYCVSRVIDTRALAPTTNRDRKWPRRPRGSFAFGIFGPRQSLYELNILTITISSTRDSMLSYQNHWHMCNNRLTPYFRSERSATADTATATKIPKYDFRRVYIYIYIYVDTFYGDISNEQEKLCPEKISYFYS